MRCHYSHQMVLDIANCVIELAHAKLVEVALVKGIDHVVNAFDGIH